MFINWTSNILARYVPSSLIYQYISFVLFWTFIVCVVPFGTRRQCPFFSASHGGETRPVKPSNVFSLAHLVSRLQQYLLKTWSTSWETVPSLGIVLFIPSGSLEKTEP